MTEPTNVIRYVVVFRDGNALGTLSHLLEEPLPGPHPPGFVGNFQVSIPRWMIEVAKARDDLSYREVDR